MQQLARLANPNTVAIYDYGRTPDGIFYYAMEYLEGLTLDELVQAAGPLPPTRVIHILDQICGSLAEAHGMGLVHRDIKPANVFLCRRGSFDGVKVLDFGLVKDLSGGTDVALTANRAFLGTPHYASPEALQDPERVTAASDLYAVAAVGYYLLTGSGSGATKSNRPQFAPELIEVAFTKWLRRESLAVEQATRSSSSSTTTRLLGPRYTCTSLSRSWEGSHTNCTGPRSHRR